jgi:hypothetical protein
MPATVPATRRSFASAVRQPPAHFRRSQVARVIFGVAAFGLLTLSAFFILALSEYAVGVTCLAFALLGFSGMARARRMGEADA